nr:basic salivary proline-rich protein 2-like [Camelus dromedarius]
MARKDLLRELDSQKLVFSLTVDRDQISHLHEKTIQVVDLSPKDQGHKTAGQQLPPGLHGSRTVLPEHQSQSLSPPTGRPGKEPPALNTSLQTPAEGAPHTGGFEEPGWSALSPEEGRDELGVQDARTRPEEAPSAVCPAPEWGSGGGALHLGRPPQPGTDKALGSGATPGWRLRAKLARLGGRRGPVGGAGRRGTDLDGAGVLAIVQQPHASPARPPAAGRTRGAADPGQGAPQPGSSAPTPSTCTITPAQSLPLPPAGAAPPPSPSPPASPPPPPPSQERAPGSLSSAPHSPCPASREGPRPEGANRGQRGGTEWQTVEPIEIGNWDDGRAGEAIMRKQYDRAKPDQPSGVPNEGFLFSLQFL